MKIPFLSKKEFFSPGEKDKMVAAIRLAEQQTSGEIRLFIESHCRFVDPVDRAAEVFSILNMQKTAARNAVLVYVALKDRQLAILGDEGIHQKVGDAFWDQAVKRMLSQFVSRETYAEAITKIIKDIGDALHLHFPYNRETDINELPDDIVFGR